MNSSSLSIQPGLPPNVRRVRGYFAPVNRQAGAATIFDPSTAKSFDVDAPPAPWVDLGWIDGFTRASQAKHETVLSGAPGAILTQARQSVGATVSLQFEHWSKLAMALSCGAQQVNVIGSTSTPVAIGTSSTATFLSTPNGAADIQAGDVIAVDADYTGQTGYLGAGASGAYLATATSGDAHWIRRITLNVGRVSAVTTVGLQLAAPLLAGVPGQGMQAQKVVAFEDREGGSFFQEWSALFVMVGEQGDTLFFHYPRLQSMAGAAESAAAIAPSLTQLVLSGKFVALPVTDALDGAHVCCYRIYLPAANALV